MLKELKRDRPFDAISLNGLLETARKDWQRITTTLFDLFYQRMLGDEWLAPIFVDVAGIDLSVHLPHIKDYWCKLLLQETRYQRHTMNKHRALHAKQSLTAENFDRWLSLFVTTVDASFSGPYAEKAKRIARAIAANMQQALNNAQPGVQSL